MSIAGLLVRRIPMRHGITEYAQRNANFSVDETLIEPGAHGLLSREVLLSAVGAFLLALVAAQPLVTVCAICFVVPVLALEVYLAFERRAASIDAAPGDRHVATQDRSARMTDVSE
jgi:hypothetical protein